MSHVQAGAGGVETAVADEWGRGQRFGRAFRLLEQQAAPAQRLQKVLGV
jgi:hypothetical protein